jgi:hypothetical protein
VRSPPGAKRQHVHWDIKQTEATVDGVLKAPHCLSVVLHLNPRPVKGTYMPTLTFDALKQQMDFKDGRKRFGCNDADFESKDMHQGDVLAFYQDVPHYGPEHPAAPSRTLDSTPGDPMTPSSTPSTSSSLSAASTPTPPPPSMGRRTNQPTDATVHPVATAETVADWRWVLFVMYSPSKGPGQDEVQEFIMCDDHEDSDA